MKRVESFDALLGSSSLWRDRKAKAKFAYDCEVWCTVLTVIYTILALHDFLKQEPIYSSPTWFEAGFCVWQNAYALDSHLLCFIGDMILGVPCALANCYKLYLEVQKGSKRERKSLLIMTTVLSSFNILHGLAHLQIHMTSGGPIYGEEIQAHLGPNYLAKFLADFVFFSSPVLLGYYVGMSGWLCLGIQIPAVFLAGSGLVPPKFGFGLVQLFFNLWYAVPRMALVGYESEADVEKRVDNGFYLASVSNLMLMPIVFAEMLACDLFYQALLGHFIFDTATMIGAWFFSKAIWDQLDEEERKAQKPNEKKSI